MNVECLRDCNAFCCRAIDTVEFDFSADEAEILKQMGAKMYFLKDGYVMEEVCPALDGKFCDLHGDERQPQCCRDNKVGGKLCQALRAKMQEKRYWEIE